MITQKRLKELLSYDPETGVFIRITKSGHTVQIGNIAGCTYQSGYVYLSADGRRYAAHRLAFLYMVGRFPLMFVDHINGLPTDNRWENLREATSQVNQRNRRLNKNSASGFTGVGWCKRERKFRARIYIDGVDTHLGFFDTAEAAAQCRAKANVEYGFHDNHGRTMPVF